VGFILCSFSAVSSSKLTELASSFNGWSTDLSVVSVFVVSVFAVSVFAVSVFAVSVFAVSVFAVSVFAVSVLPLSYLPILKIVRSIAQFRCSCKPDFHRDFLHSLGSRAYLYDHYHSVC
jgi:magnesium-transporting ATPase (P-type)